jgi:hypothetical protein
MLHSGVKWQETGEKGAGQEMTVPVIDIVSGARVAAKRAILTPM